MIYGAQRNLYSRGTTRPHRISHTRSMLHSAMVLAAHYSRPVGGFFGTLEIHARRLHLLCFINHCVLRSPVSPQNWTLSTPAYDFSTLCSAIATANNRRYFPTCVMPPGQACGQDYSTVLLLRHQTWHGTNVYFDISYPGHYLPKICFGNFEGRVPLLSST